MCTLTVKCFLWPWPLTYSPDTKYYGKTNKEAVRQATRPDQTTDWKLHDIIGNLCYNFATILHFTSIIHNTLRLHYNAVLYQYQYLYQYLKSTLHKGNRGRLFLRLIYLLSNSNTYICPNPEIPVIWSPLIPRHTICKIPVNNT